MPARISGLPVDSSAPSIWSTVEVGAAPRSSATAPATCGVAIEVPLKTANRLPGTDDVILLPGASRSRMPAWLEKPEIRSSLVELPTAIAEEMQPGAPMKPSKPSLPLAITVAMPAARRLSITSLRRSLSQWPLNAPPPRLMLTAAMSKLRLSSSTRSRPRIWSELKVRTHGLGSSLSLQIVPVKRENT